MKTVPVHLVLLVTLFASAAAATVIHVCPDGAGDYPNLQTAVAAAASGDEIELCDGVFTGIENVEIDAGSKSLTFRSINGYEATTIDAAVLGGEFSEYLPHVAFLLGPGSSTRIAGISIINAGNVDLDTWEYGDGGAIRCLGNSLDLDRVRIEGRFPLGAVHGAGVFVESGVLSASDCVFTYNRAHYGAAIYAGGPTALDRCSFVGNGTCIGAVVEFQAGGSVEDCLFQGCGGAATACGSESDPGGRALSAGGGPTSVLRTTFLDNHSASGGTGIGSGASDLQVEGCTFQDCSSSYGSACAVARGTFRQCRFVGNYAANSGGALWCGAGPVTLDRCAFVRSRNGVSYNTVWATVRVTGVATLQQCTFVGTSTGADVMQEPGAAVVLDRAIMAFGTDESPRVLCAEPPAGVAVSCTDIFGNAGGDWVGCLEGRSGLDGNISADPMFCALQADDLSLDARSPCAPKATSCDQIGAYGVSCGATAVTPVTWGQIKAQYR